MRILWRATALCLCAFLAAPARSGERRPVRTSARRSVAKKSVTTNPVPNGIPLGLEDYVRIVLKQSDRAIVAYNTFRNSQIFYGIASRDQFGPSLNLTSDLKKTNSELNATTTTTEEASGSAALSQPLFLSGGRLSAAYTLYTDRTETDPSIVSHGYVRPAYSFTVIQPLFLFVGNPALRSWKRSRLAIDIAGDTYRRDMQVIENDARSTYYDLLYKRAQLEVERSKSESSTRAHEVTRALVDGGRLPGIELARSNLRLQQDVRRLRNAETSFQKAINDALEFASMKIDAGIDLVSQLDYAHLPLNLDELIEHAFLHRPDYKVAKSNLELAELQVRETLEGNNPELNATASVSKATTGTGIPPDSHSRVWVGGVNMTWSIFDSGRTRLRAQAARNDLENEKVFFRGLERSIRTEVTNAYLELQRTEQQLQDLQSSREQARVSVEAVRIRYQNGRDRLLDVFDSEQQLRDLELEYLDIVRAANLAKDRLALLIGTPLAEVTR